MLEANEVIRSARFKLSDTRKQRWTDERLLELLNEALDIVSINTILFTKYINLRIESLTPQYDISDVAVKIHRAEYKGKVLPFYTHAQMDKEYGEWQQVEGDAPEIIVYDLQNQGEFVVYPIVRDIEANSNITYNSPYGIITDIEMFDAAPVWNENIGDLGEYETENFIRLFITKRHDIVGDIEDEIEVSNVAKSILTNFVVSEALSDNADSQNLVKADAHKKNFEEGLKKYKEAKASNYGDKRMEVGYYDNFGN